MKTLRLATYGGPGALLVVDLPQPRPGEREVRDEVRATAVASVGALLG